MALPPLALVRDLEMRLGLAVGSLIGAELVRAEAVLADTSALVRSAAGKTWVDVQGVLAGVPDVAITVTLAAARRAWENPSGLASESIGAYSYTRGGDASGGVYLTEDERRDLRSSASRSGLRTMRTTRDDVGYAAVAVLDANGHISPDGMPFGIEPPW